MTQLRVAAAQLECIHGDVDKNLARMHEVMRMAASDHDVVLFPEAYVMGFADEDQVRAMAEPLNGPIVQELQRLARIYDTYLVAGMAERLEQQIYNTSVVLGPNGLSWVYRKIHLWRNERWMSPGSTMCRGSIQDIPVGLMICYDVEFPETARTAALLGSQLVLLTNGNMAPYGPVHRTAIRARAQENQIFLVSANLVGTSGSMRFVGESCVASPYGDILAALDHDDEGLLSADLDICQVTQSRKDYNYLEERRIRWPGATHTEGPHTECWTFNQE